MTDGIADTARRTPVPGPTLSLKERDRRGLDFASL
jgi:hypothetical protein